MTAAAETIAQISSAPIVAVLARYELLMERSAAPDERPERGKNSQKGQGSSSAQLDLHRRKPQRVHG